MVVVRCAPRRIFDDHERTLLGGARHTISAYDYLNDSARDMAAEIRRTLDTFFARYPDTHQPELHRRIRTRKDAAHYAALFELIIHELLLRSGCRVEAVEPNVPGSSSRPDFLVAAPDDTRFYLEAVSPTGMSAAESAAARRLSEAFQALDSVQSADFLVGVTCRGTPSASISGRLFRREVERWLRAQNYEDVMKAWQDQQRDLPTLAYAEHGVEFHIEAIPRLRTRGELPDRAIGVEMQEPQWVDDSLDIREAIRRKAGKYGELDLPYVIAVNAMGRHADEEDAVDALLGSQAVQVWKNADGSTGHSECRIRDGVWSPTQFTRVSAVLSTERLSGWTLGERRARLFLNPHAARPLTASPLPIDSITIEEGVLRRTSGQSIGELLGLREHWPS